MAVENLDLKPGDMVRQVGGIVMQIVAIDVRRGIATCHWFGPRGGEKRRNVLLSSLVKASPRRPITFTFG